MSKVLFLCGVILLVKLYSASGCKHCEQIGNHLYDTGCHSCYQRGNHNRCYGKRSVRATTKQIHELLLSFDAEITAEMIDEIQDWNNSERKTFLEDLQQMNKAAESEYQSLKDSKNSMNQNEILQNVAEKVSQDFKDKSWFKRLRSFAGEKIAFLVNNGISDS